ncbi:MAG: bifunctional oligoribonuclease/PAP phosphatase NrnA [Bacilli bacterium]|nr:bifunctional oligoribonuclease/PAP phosphatase NrnA [Bacilli bacterium]
MFFRQSIYKKIYNKIKKADIIVIARHVGPDPDALGSSLGLKQIIEDNFKGKKVYVIGNPASKFSYLGVLDKLPDDFNNDEALLIVTDTPDRKRVDGVDPLNFKNSIKIDHHPFIEKTCTLEWIDDKASSAAQMVLELALNTKLKLTSLSAEKLYTGIVADTNRFMFAYTSSKTFYLVSRLLEEVSFDITKVYDNLYLRDYKEIKFQGYLSENFNITENGVGYIIIDDEILKKYNVDPAAAGNMINNFNHINEMLVWLTATLDKDMGSYRISVRSRGPIINEVVSNHGGGGHIYASGTRLKTASEIESLIHDLDIVTLNYKEKTLED